MGLVIRNGVADADSAQPVRLPAWLSRFVAEAPNFLKPDLTTEPRPTNEGEARYVRSFLIMRLVVGALGVALPLWLVLGDNWLSGDLFSGDPHVRDSLSSYYYSGVRELFVGTLSAIGVFFVTYKVAERSLDNTLSLLAGGAVVFVVLFPTGLPADVSEPTPLQEKLGETWVQRIHFGGALVFILSLAVISYFYGVRESGRAQGNLSPKTWKWFHWGCAIVIVGALLGIGVDMLTEWGPNESVLIGEWVAVWAFGASWLMKGWELDYLLGRGSRAHAGVEKAHDPAISPLLTDQ